jgi:hypothetical protein
MSYALPIPETQWQHRLRTLKGLALTFLIYSQHQGVVGRVRPAHSFSMNRRKQ